MTASAIATVVAIFGSGRTDVFQPGNDAAPIEVIAELASTPVGLVGLLLPGQLAFAVIVIAAAMVSPEPLGRRLGFRGGRLPIWTWPILMAGTLFMGMIGGMLVRLIPFEPSPYLDTLASIMTQTTGASLVILLVLASLVPGVVEEVLFRGYLQGRLLARWPAALAIPVATLLFALAHFDLHHSVGVIPLGLWLGVIAWRTRSIGASIACHVANNAIAIIIVNSLDLDVDAAAPVWMTVATGGAFLVSIPILVMGGRRSESA